MQRTKWMAVAITSLTFMMGLFSTLPGVTHAMEMEGMGNMDCAETGCIDDSSMKHMTDCVDHCLQLQEEQSELAVIDGGRVSFVLEVDRVQYGDSVEQAQPIRGSPDTGQRKRHLSVQKRE